mgnify:CR=1 FL=1
MEILNITYNKIVTIISNDIVFVNGEEKEINYKVYSIKKKSDFFEFIKNKECFKIKVSQNINGVISKLQNFGFECSEIAKDFDRVTLYCSK